MTPAAESIRTRARTGLARARGLAAAASARFAPDAAAAWDAEIARRRRDILTGRVAPVDGPSVFRRAFAKYA